METFGFQRILITWPEDAAFEGRKRGTRVSCHGTNCVREFCSQLVKAVNYTKEDKNPTPNRTSTPTPTKEKYMTQLTQLKSPLNVS